MAETKYHRKKIGTATVTASGKTMGRPTVITPAVMQEVIMTVGDGGTKADAAAICRVSVEALYAAIAADEDFAHEIRRAEALCKLHHLRRIRVGEERWQSSAWFLERKHPKEFGIGVAQGEEDRAIVMRRIVNSRPAIGIAATAAAEGALPEGVPAAVHSGNGNGNGNGANGTGGAAMIHHESQVPGLVEGG